jgi:hypothetical protein
LAGQRLAQAAAEQTGQDDARTERRGDEAQ